MCICVQVPAEAGRGWQNPRSWSYIQVSHQCGCWEVNSSPLQECQALLTAELIFSPGFAVSSNPPNTELGVSLRLPMLCRAGDTVYPQSPCLVYMMPWIPLPARGRK